MLHLAANLEDKPVLVVGAGAVGAHKAGLLVEAGGIVTVIAAEVLAPLPRGLASLEVRPYRTGDLRGFALVVSATGDEATNDRIVAEATAERTWLNVVDDPARSTFFFTATHRSGDVVVSVSTEGASPALAQVLRTRIAAALPANLADVASRLRAERQAMHRGRQSTERVDWTPRILELLDAEEAEARPGGPAASVRTAASTSA